jgi:hypothetical protein
MSEERSQQFKDFLKISSDLTGFSAEELQATGQSEIYFDFFSQTIGSILLDTFLTHANEQVMVGSYGGLARAIIWMFYFGEWHKIDWSDLTVPEDHVDHKNNVNHILSPQAFRAGLGWQAIGTNAPGANQPGFKSWSLEPRP